MKSPIVSSRIIVQRCSSGGRYRIRIEVTTGVARSTAELLFEINKPPENGTLAVSPEAGTATNMTFFITALDYQDEDLPLMYAFSFELDGATVQLSDPTTCNRTAVMLPQGNPSSSFRYAITGQMTDAYTTPQPLRA